MHIEIATLMKSELIQENHTSQIHGISLAVPASYPYRKLKYHITHCVQTCLLEWGGIPKVVPPLLLEGTLEPEVVHFAIRSGISFDMVITHQNTLWGGFFEWFWRLWAIWAGKVLKMG